MQITSFEAEIANRPAFKEAFPSLYPVHRETQQHMFGAARCAHLPTDTPDMMRGLNELLGLALDSRKQLSIREMQRATQAIEEGAFDEEWHLKAPEVEEAPVVTGTTPPTYEEFALDYRRAENAREYEREVAVIGRRLLERKIELRSRISLYTRLLVESGSNLDSDTRHELRLHRSSARRELCLLDNDYPTI